jgi:hypothetical protein
MRRKLCNSDWVKEERSAGIHRKWVILATFIAGFAHFNLDDNLKITVILSRKSTSIKKSLVKDSLENQCSVRIVKDQVTVLKTCLQFLRFWVSASYLFTTALWIITGSAARPIVILRLILSPTRLTSSLTRPMRVTPRTARQDAMRAAQARIAIWEMWFDRVIWCDGCWHR